MMNSPMTRRMMVAAFMATSSEAGYEIFSRLLTAVIWKPANFSLCSLAMDATAVH